MEVKEMADLLRDLFNDYWMLTLNTPSIKINWKVMESIAWRANQAEDEVIGDEKND